MDDIFENFEKISKKINNINKTKDNIQKQQQDEIEKNKKIINKKYEEIFNKTYKQEKNNIFKLSKLNESLKEYSTFDKKILGDIISKLMTIVENKKYVYIFAKHKTYERECTVFGSETFFQEKNVDLIVEENYASNNYFDSNEDENQVKKIIDKNRGILLETSNFNNKFITLYYNINNKIHSQVDYKNFNYVQEFIDILINYRYVNKIKEIKEKDLLKLLYDFINIKKDLITEKHNKLIEEEIKKKQEELLKKEKQKEEKIIKKYIPKTLLINKINEEDKKELENLLNNIDVRVDTTSGIVKANFEKELFSSNLMYIGKLSLNGIIEDCECGPYNDWYFVDAEINHDAIISIYDIENFKGFYLPYTYFNDLPYGTHIKTIINEKYFIIIYSPDSFCYSYGQGFIISKCEIDEEKITHGLIDIGKYIEKKSNIHEEKGRKYILTKKQV